MARIVRPSQTSKFDCEKRKTLWNNGTGSTMFKFILQPISGRVDRASATETVDTGSIPGRVKPKTIKIGIHSFPA